MGRRRAGRALALLVAGALAGACAPAASGAPAGPPAAAAPEAATPQPAASAEAGLYTPAQAERGRQVFNTVCSACHGMGEFRGRMFELTWKTQPIGHFFQHISTAMPQDRPGSLSPEEYASVVAYVLQLNGQPAGTRELSTDAAALEQLRWP